MKRDMSFVREILLKVEGSDGKLKSQDLELSRHSKEEHDYHVRLMYEAGLIEGVDATSYGGFNILNLRLSWDGHDFLDAIRDDKVWAGVGARLKAVGGSATFEVVKALAVELGMEALGIRGPK